VIDDLKDYRHSREFFDRRVPAVFTWFLAIVLAVFAGALTWAALGEVDIVVKAPALLRPSQNVSTLKNAVAGPLLRKAFVHGQKVNRGDLLWTVDTTALEVDRANTALQLTRVEARVHSITAYGRAVQAETDDLAPSELEAKTRIAVYLAETSRLTLNWQRAQRAWEREKAVPPGLTSVQKVADLETNASLARIALESYRAQERLRVREETMTLLAQRETLENRRAELNRQSQDAQVRAPLDGTVEELKKLNPGDFVLVGEEIARLVPEGARHLNLELTVDNRDVAELAPGMAVTVRFTALPPSEYGNLEARVATVPADATNLANQAVFVVTAIADQPWLENRAGHRIDLRPGMGAEARILIKRKNILRFLLEKLDFLS